MYTKPPGKHRLIDRLWQPSQLTRQILVGGLRASAALLLCAVLMISPSLEAGYEGRHLWQSVPDMAVTAVTTGVITLLGGIIAEYLVWKKEERT